MIETYNNEFQKSFECNINLCPLCKSAHDDIHTIISYQNKDYVCNQHDENFIKYFEDCKRDISLTCFEEHKNHKYINYEDKIINIKNIRKRMNCLKKNQ